MLNLNWRVLLFDINLFGNDVQLQFFAFILLLLPQLQLLLQLGRRHLRSADVHTCTVPRTQTRLGDRSFAVAGPRLWNNLPVELRQRDICLSEFKFAETRRLMTFCLSAPCTSTLTYLLTYLQLLLMLLLLLLGLMLILD